MTTQMRKDIPSNIKGQTVIQFAQFNVWSLGECVLLKKSTQTEGTNQTRRFLCMQ